MKILHVYKDFDPPIRGGIEGHMAMLCRYQRQWGEVEALTCSRSWRTRIVERDGTRVTEVGEWGRLQNAPVSPGFPLRLRRAKADVVVVHMPNPTAEVACLLLPPRGKIVVRYHSDVVRQAAAMRLYGPVQMQFMRRAAMILPTSEPYLDTSPVLQRFREKCRVVPLGIEAERFNHADEAAVAELRRRYGHPFVFFCGRHRYYKGLEHLVRAANEIKAPVVIAGDGPETPRLKALSSECGALVSFPGPLSHEDLVAHLHACAVFVFPSIARSEAFGLSILEAHAAGTPVVATRLGSGVEYANLHNQTGLNVAPGNPEALADAVNALLSNEERRERLGAYARDRVIKKFRAETIARAEFDCYQEACGC